MECNVSETVCAFIIGRDALSDVVHVFAAHVLSLRAEPWLYI